MDKIAIVGVGQTAFSAERRADTFSDLVYEAVQEALADSAFKISDIDNIVTTSNDFWDGRTISSMAVGDAAGAAFGGGKPISTVEGDGTFGAFYGLTRVLSGLYGTTLVVAHSKASEGDDRLITNAYFDPVEQRALGLDRVSAAALAARVFMEKTKTRDEEVAAVVEKNRRFGSRNPKAHLRAPVSAQEALKSRLIAAPLREADISPLSDGAAALIFAREERARKSPAPVWVKGVGLIAGAPLTERNLAEDLALREAGRRAYAMAGVSAREIGVAELSEEFSYQELLWRHELALSEPERINLSGGCLSAHAAVAAGLVRIVECVLQLRGKAETQADSPALALAHGQGGLAGQSHCVWILGKN